SLFANFSDFPGNSLVQFICFRLLIVLWLVQNLRANRMVIKELVNLQYSRIFSLFANFSDFPGNSLVQFICFLLLIVLWLVQNLTANPLVLKELVNLQYSLLFSLFANFSDFPGNSLVQFICFRLLIVLWLV